MIYLRNRYYDSRSGRFITEDPAQDGLNWYVYAANNPISFVDPWGLKAGDAFNSIEEVYADAYLCYYGVTEFTQLEQGSAIYSYSDVDSTGTVVTKYSYTEPVIGEPDQVELVDRKNDIPKNGTFAGYWHSHPGYTEEMCEYAEQFSAPDERVINGEEAGTPLALFTPYGNIKILRSTGENYGFYQPKKRIPGETLSTGNNFNTLSLIEKILLALRYGNKLPEFSESTYKDTATSQFVEQESPWYRDKESIEGLEIRQIYNNPQKYANFIVGK